jgi:hypothetical protein
VSLTGEAFSEGSDPLPPRAWVRPVMRTALALLAMWALYFADDRYTAFSRTNSYDFGFHTGLWLSWAALVVLAGFLFGLAAWFPFTKVRYLWSRLLLAALALLPLAHYLYVFGYQVPHTGSSGSGWIGRQWYVLSGVVAQTASAALVGVALASGFRTNTGGGFTDASVDHDRS